MWSMGSFKKKMFDFFPHPLHIQFTMFYDTMYNTYKKDVLMKERFYRFMRGRYGSDGFSRFLGFVSVALFLAYLVAQLLKLSPVVGSVMYVLALVCLIFSLFRTFSKNCNARSRENYAYYRCVNRIKGFFNSRKERIKQSKDYCFFRCPKCHVTTRVPRGKGKIRIRCPKCSEQFVRKS